MGQNNDHIGQEDEDPSRTLDAVKPLYEIGSRTGGSWLLSILGEASFVLHVFPQLPACRTSRICPDYKPSWARRAVMTGAGTA
jgi:hypothetical protein